MKNVNKFHLS